MRQVQGSAGVSLLECVNPAKNKWRIRWDIRPHEDGSADYMEEEFDHRPTPEEVRAVVVGWYNGQTDNAILSGFTYEGVMVWLSRENQFNYKAAYDLAVQTGGMNLPVIFKFGAEDKPEYREFKTLSELTVFYTSAMTHIQQCLEAGWQKKDQFSAEQYR